MKIDATGSLDLNGKAVSLRLDFQPLNPTEHDALAIVLAQAPDSPGFAVSLSPAHDGNKLAIAGSISALSVVSKQLSLEEQRDMQNRIFHDSKDEITRLTNAIIARDAKLKREQADAAKAADAESEAQKAQDDADAKEAKATADAVVERAAQILADRLHKETPKPAPEPAAAPAAPKTVILPLGDAPGNADDGSHTG